jgi:hypothetical protein
MADSRVCGGSVMVFVAQAGSMVLMSARELSLNLDLSAWRRALHGERQPTPNGEQHGEQQDEPDAKRLHRC